MIHSEQPVIKCSSSPWQFVKPKNKKIICFFSNLFFFLEFWERNEIKLFSRLYSKEKKKNKQLSLKFDSVCIFCCGILKTLLPVASFRSNSLLYSDSHIGPSEWKIISFCFYSECAKKHIQSLCGSFFSRQRVSALWLLNWGVMKDGSFSRTYRSVNLAQIFLSSNKWFYSFKEVLFENIWMNHYIL